MLIVNFVFVDMTKEQFENIRVALLQDDNSVLAPIYQNYADYCKKYLVKNSQCRLEDAEDIFVEAIMNFRQKIIDNKLTEVNNVKNYLYRTCQNMLLVRIEREKRWNRQLTDVEHFFYDGDSTSDYKEDLLIATKKAWELLNEKCRDLLYYVYVDKINMTEIAKQLGYANSNVAKTSKMRCHQKFVSMAKEYSSKVM